MKTCRDEPLEQSPTLAKLSGLAIVNPFNVDDPVQINRAIASSLVQLIDALDREGIQFSAREDHDALWQLLSVNYQLITQMRPDSPVRH